MPNPESDSRPEYEIRQFNFNNVPETSEFKDFRLKAFKTPDGWEDISTWKDIYRSFCQYVFNCKPNQIKALKDLDDTFLSRNVFFSSEPDNLNRAFKLKTKFYVEQNLSSSGIVDIIKKLIYYCRLPASQFIVRYEAPVTEEASAPEPSAELEPLAGLQSVPVLPKLPCFMIDNPPSLKNTGSKPVSIKFGLRLNNWNDVLEEVVRFIDFYYPECIDDIYDDYGPKGKVRKLILAKSKRSFTNSSSTKAPRFIRQNLYVKADLATDDVIQLAAAFLSYCDIALSDVLVEYRPKGRVAPELPLAPSSNAQPDQPEPDESEPDDAPEVDFDDEFDELDDESEGEFEDDDELDDDEEFDDEEFDDQFDEDDELSSRSFTLDESIPDLTNAKALSISFGEKEFEILSWSGIVLQTAIYIDQNEPDAFNSLIEQYGQPNSKPHLFSHDKFEKLSCKPVNSDYYVNTNFCATTAVKTAQLFLDSCKLPLSEVRIEYLPPGKISNTRTANDVNSAEDPSRQGVSIDDSSFTKPVNKSMFETCVVVPTQLHELFLSHLSAVPDPGKNVPVTIWFNSTAYQAVIYTPDFSVCGAPPQVRFTWSPSSPIAKALKNECPESYQLLQGRARVSKENVPDEITVSCSSNLDEFIMRVNHRRARVSEPHPEAPSLFERSEEEVSLLCQTILHRAQNMFPNNSCHETQLDKMRSTFAEGEFTSDKELLDFITQNHLGVYSSKWVYFLTRAVEDCLLKMLEELQQEGQIMAYYNLLYDNKQDLFDSISVFKDETAISGLFNVLALRPHYRIVDPFYPTPSYVALKEDCTIKDALINYFEHNTVLKYDQIKSAFPYIPDTEIQETLRSDNDFILLENGSFTYYDKIYIDKALADKLLEKVVTEIEKEDFISCNQIDLSPARVNNSAEISPRGLLDYFCKKILPAKYKRIGNVISDASKPVSSSAIIEKLCETKDYVTLDELKALADELSASWQTAFATAFEKMVRVDKDRFVSPSLIQFDVEEIDKVLEDNFVLSNDFIPLQDVTNFAVFPQYDSFSWTWFLLESFCRKYSKKFGFMVAVPNSQNVGAIVKKSANFGDYTELMANAVINDEIELSEDAVGRFLIGAHYIAIVKQNSIQNVLAKAQVLLEERG